MADVGTQSDADAPETYLKVSDVAKMFDVLPSTVRVWLNDGTLRGIKIGKGHYWRIPVSAAMELANKRHGDHSQ